MTAGRGRRRTARREPQPDNLLDRLLYKGVLPRYAFPTDVVSFHVFDATSPRRSTPSSSTRRARALRRAQPVRARARWCGSTTRSGRPARSTRRCSSDRFDAWQRALALLRVLGLPLRHARPHERGGDAARSATARPAASEGTFGKAMNWMRPPASPTASPRTRGPARTTHRRVSYATRAKLVAEGPGAREQVDGHHGPHLRRPTSARRCWSRTPGPKNEGYKYCTQCGLIEPTALASGDVFGTHKKPYPGRGQPGLPRARARAAGSCSARTSSPTCC